jgi:hypothetical protein
MFVKMSYFSAKRIAYCWVRHRLGEVKLDLTFRPIVRDRQGLNAKILIHEGANSLPRKSERPGLILNPPPPALSTAQDQTPVSVLTGAVPDCDPLLPSDLVSSK